MKPHDDKLKLVENAFKHAHNNRQSLPVTKEWERKVMSHIHSLQAAKAQVIVDAWEAPLIWKTAAAISISAIIILAWSVMSGVSAEFEAARLLVEDPVSYVFTASLFP